MTDDSIGILFFFGIVLGVVVFSSILLLFSIDDYRVQINLHGLGEKLCNTQNLTYLKSDFPSGSDGVPVIYCQHKREPLIDSVVFQMDGEKP